MTSEVRSARRGAALLVAALGMTCTADPPERAAAKERPAHEAAHEALPEATIGPAHPADHGGPAVGPGSDAPTRGYAPVTISPADAVSMNLTTALVEERTFTKALRTVGVVAADETRTSHVHAKVRGWIENVAVNYVGQKVRRGQTLCAIYSQEIYAAELELLGLIERAPREPLLGRFAEAERRAQEQVIAAARRRLALWDVSPAEIARLEQTREPRRTFVLSAPRSGVVIAKQALAGMFIDPSVELYLLSDLSRVWVLVDVYEPDVPFVHAGDEVELTFAGRSEKAAKAKATFVAPVFDESTRTLKVRYELDNEDGTLRPGMFATAEMSLSMGKSLAVPENAVIRTGERAIVFVVQGERLVPREIELGGLVGDAYRVEAGLSAGERVATGAQFLLDSESRLRATSAPGAGHVGH